MMAIIIRDVATGRKIKGADGFIATPKESAGFSRSTAESAPRASAAHFVLRGLAHAAQIAFVLSQAHEESTTLRLTAAEFLDVAGASLTHCRLCPGALGGALLGLGIGADL
jgi:hypothetical protein